MHGAWSIILDESSSARTLGTRQLIEAQTSKQGQPILFFYTTTASYNLDMANATKKKITTS
jgi:hypothetical protein